MPVLININNITGSSPYQVYLCLSGYSPCYFVEQITSSELPYEFYVPEPIENFSHYCVKVIDSDGCIINDCFNIT